MKVFWGHSSKHGGRWDSQYPTKYSNLLNSSVSSSAQSSLILLIQTTVTVYHDICINLATCIILSTGLLISYCECINLPVNQTLRNCVNCVQCEKCWTSFSVTKSLFHGYCSLKICRALCNVLSNSLHYAIKCLRQNSLVLKTVSGILLQVIIEVMKYPKLYRLLHMACLLRLSTQLKTHFNALSCILRQKHCALWVTSLYY
jgi:hypothetical protein